MARLAARALCRALQRHWHWVAVAVVVMLYLGFNVCEWVAICP
ncbi:hypothetical protein ACGLHS_26425 [Variovorax sp. VaC1]